MAKELSPTSDDAQKKSFEAFVRNGSHTPSLLPTLEQNLHRVEDLLSTVDYAAAPPYVPKELIPLPIEQGLTLTPYDEVEGLEAAIAPEEAVRSWEMQRDFNLRLANHPVRLNALRELESAGFTPPQKVDGILQKALENGEPLQLSDLGQNTDFVEMHHRIIDLPTSEEEKEEFISTAIKKKQIHRTHLLATGPFSFVGRRPRSIVGLGAMPDIVGSVEMAETALQMGMIVHVPEVGMFSDPEKAGAFAKEVITRIENPENPLFTGRSEEDISYMKDLWRSSLVGTLEVDPHKALKRAELLKEAGVNSWRIYGHTQGGDIVETTRVLRREYADDEIFSSQITNDYTALACEYAGADAIVVGVGSGGRCSTADRSQLIPSNAHLPWALRGRLQIPIIGEGGAVNEPLVSLLVGMSGVYGSGSLGGGTMEAPGGAFYFKDKKGRLVKPYGGEASDRFKYLSKRLYGGTGIPYFSEGKQTYKELLTDKVSMTQNVIEKWEDFILGAVVMGIDEGPFTYSAVQNLNPSPLWKKSATTQNLQKPH